MKKSLLIASILAFIIFWGFTIFLPTRSEAKIEFWTLSSLECYDEDGHLTGYGNDCEPEGNDNCVQNCCD